MHVIRKYGRLTAAVCVLPKFPGSMRTFETGLFVMKALNQHNAEREFMVSTLMIPKWGTLDKPETTSFMEGVSSAFDEGFSVKRVLAAEPPC